MSPRGLYEHEYDLHVPRKAWKDGIIMVRLYEDDSGIEDRDVDGVKAPERPAKWQSKDYQD